MFTKKRVIISLLLLLSLWGIIAYYRNKNTVVPVQTETVKRSTLSETVSVTGEVVPREYADLSFQSIGMVDEVNVKEGDMVVAGQRIASVDRAILFSQLKQARITASITEQNEKQSRNRKNTLGKGWDDLKPEERTAITLKTEQTQENVRMLESQMKQNVLLAPFDGQITKLNIRVGEIVTLGKSIGRVSKTESFVIESRVPESDIIKIALGMESQITFDAFTTEEIFSAQVEDVAKSATVIQDVVSYVVKFHLERMDTRLKEGMTANIDIETAKRENVLTVPFRALTKENGKTYAELKQSDGTFVKTEVTTGLEGDDGTIEIKSGLKEGNEVTIGSVQVK
ncbi:MAG: efflux RND transporter periplasmic adaptor subunit [Candidatus Moranbacteria bacterium]|nr:efflux RND transporter periplasmic adaptor subunit [Candidatus Moranbacteria bacterium]MDD3965060.1 efflux RND transporter periplasmic adaptor subunit [Candidatus Moranbacteria bacterium]